MKLADALTCQRCSLAATRTQVVIGSGDITSRLVLIGEAPGRTEDEGGQPFLGRSGQLLFSLLLEEVGLTRDDCYITNVVKCRPPNNRTPTTSELRACRAWWDLQVPLMRSSVTVTLGLTATRAVLGLRAPMAELHGRAVASDVGVVLPTYHPAAALRQGPSVVAVMRSDLRQVRKLLDS